MRNTLRNILICMLFVLAVYQIGTLWFDNFSIKTIGSIFNDREVETVTSMDYVVSKVLVSVGENRIVGKTNGIYESDYKPIFDSGIVETLNEGDSVDIGGFDWNNILKNRAVIYEFGCVFDNSSLPYIFNSVKTDKVNNINSFNYVILMPSSSGSDMTVVLYNSFNNKYTTKTVKNSDNGSSVYQATTAFANSDASAYISSEQSGFNIFSKNVFIPGWQENSIEYTALQSIGAYADESMAEENAEDYFDNPVTKWRSDENDALTYSDETTVVKYDKKTNVFEYSNYKIESTNDKSFAINYMKAVNTIKQDSFMKNEIYLSSYTATNGKYTFNFNYKINDRLLLPSDEIKQKTGLDSFVSVSTESGKTTKYRKYCFYYDKTNQIKVADCDFVSAIDKIYKDELVDNIRLCYIAEINKPIELNWIIDIGNNRYVESVERE